MIKQANNIYKEWSSLDYYRGGVTKMDTTEQLEILREYRKIKEILGYLDQFRAKGKAKRFILDVDEIRKNARRSLAATTSNGDKY